MILSNFHSLYNKILDLAAHPRAILWLALLAASESIFFPIPQDVMMVPMMLAQRARIWLIASVTTISSAVGGAIGYGIGMIAMQEVGMPILEFLNAQESYYQFEKTFRTYGWAMILIGAITPIPYKVVCLASGASGLPFMMFIGISFVGRGARFFALGVLCHLFGARVLQAIDRYFAQASILVCVVIIAAIAVIANL